MMFHNEVHHLTNSKNEFWLHMGERDERIIIIIKKERNKQTKMREKRKQK